MMTFDIITIFPNLLQSPLEEGIVRRACQRGQIRVNTVNLRDFADDTQQTTDDRPFGGGEGMVMKPEPLASAVEKCSTKSKELNGKVVLLSPQGRRYSQQIAQEYSTCDHLILVCGRYEGVDERFIQQCVDEELSIGDYILTGGELAAMVVVDSVTRLLPDVLGCSASKERDTFSRRLLKQPQYTRPREFQGCKVPEQLLSGNHLEIERYRFLESVRTTLKKRPQLLVFEEFSQQERNILRKEGLLEQILSIQKQKVSFSTNIFGTM